MGILEEICKTRREALRSSRNRISPADLEGSRWYDSPRRDFAEALRRGDENDPIRFLAEIKRASPSAGWIRPDADPTTIAREYNDAGASALSILTEPDYFRGDPSYLGEAREEVRLPLLMKDFFVDPWQVAWARSLGADAILLIVAACDRSLFGDLLAAARELGLDCLVEVHDESECERALMGGARIIGINHRDLRTFSIDETLGERLIPRLDPEIVRIAESGIRERSDVERNEAAGFDAVLAGEALMRAPSPGEALRALRGDR